MKQRSDHWIQTTTKLTSNQAGKLHRIKHLATRDLISIYNYILRLEIAKSHVVQINDHHNRIAGSSNIIQSNNMIPFINEYSDFVL